MLSMVRCGTPNEAGETPQQEADRGEAAKLVAELSEEDRGRVPKFLPAA